MITLPAEFVFAHGIKEGDDIGILANHVLKVDPMKEGEYPSYPLKEGKYEDQKSNRVEKHSPRTG